MPQINIRWADNTDELRRHLKEGLNSIEAMKSSVERLTRSLGGEGLFRAAHNLTAAITEIGGAIKLTAQEQERASTTLDKAIAKYKAMGQSAPEAMRKLADELRPQPGLIQNITTSLGPLGTAFAGVFAGFTAANLVNKAVGSLINFGQQAVETAGTLVDLSNKTGLSTETLQRMQFVAKQSGTDMSAFADAAFKMGVNVSEGTKKAREGAEMLGISWKELRAASPDQQFEMVVQALERMEDPQKRNEAAVALFGKTAAQILPAIADGYTKIASQATVAGDAQVHAVDELADAWDRFKTRTTSSLVHAAGSIILLREAVSTLTKEERDFILETDKSIKTTDDFAAALIRAANAKLKAKDIELQPTPKAAGDTSFVADLKAAEDAYRHLTAAKKADIFAALQLNASNEKIINDLDVTEEVLSVAKKAFEDHKQAIAKAASEAQKFADAMEELDSAGKGWEGTLKTIDGTVVEAIKFYLQAGVSQNALATAYGLTATQVKSVDSALKDNIAVVKIWADIHKMSFERAMEIQKQWHDEDQRQLKANNDALADNFKTEQSFLKKRAALNQSATHEIITNWQNTIDALGKPPEGMEAQWARTAQAVSQEFAAELSVESMKSAVTAAGVADGTAFANGLKSVFDSIPDILQQAFTGGGGVQGAVKAIGVKAGAALSDELMHSKAGMGFADSLASMFGIKSAKGASMLVSGLSSIATGGITAAINVGVGLLTKFLSGIGGPNKEQKEARSNQADVVKQLQGMATEAQKAEGAMKDTYHTIAIVARDAFLSMGLSAHEADLNIQDLLDTQVPEAFERGKQALQTALDQQKNIASGVDKITAAWQNAGSFIPESMQGTIRELLKMNGLTDAQRIALGKLAESAEPDFDKLQSDAESYGISLDALGPKFQQANIEKTAAKIGKSFDALKQAGGDVGGILLGMSDEISTLVNDAKKFGSAIPENMKPLIQNLIDAGKLLDENGKAITDITTIRFEATPLDKGLDTLNRTLIELMDTLANLPNIMKGLPPVHIKAWLDIQNPDAGTTPPSPPPAPPGDNTGPEAGRISGDVVMAARGGLVTRHGLMPLSFSTGARYMATGGPVWPFIPRGTDTIPAMLSPGEMVIPAGRASLDTPGNVTLNVNGPLVDVLLPHGSDLYDADRVLGIINDGLRDDRRLIRTNIGRVAIRAVNSGTS